MFNEPFSTLINWLKSFRSKGVLQRRIRKFALALPLLALLLLLLISKKEKPISIPYENPQKTIGWKEYKNTEYNFSFKYPEGQLSDFNVTTNDLGTSTYNRISSEKFPPNPNAYNVTFEAGAIKYKGKLDDFLKHNLKETKMAVSQEITLGAIKGKRFLNLEKKSDVYFLYNIFQKGDFIYNFALLSDDPILIKANQNLLDEILTTVKLN